MKGIARKFIFLVSVVALALPCIASAADIKPLQLGLPPLSDRGRRPVESEHRPAPVRIYSLNDANLSKDAEAYLLHPDGSIERVAIKKKGGGITLSFRTPFGDGPMHGVHNLYVIDRKVIDGILVVRVAKWMTIHHHCSWGHKYKYDRERLRPRFLDTVPLEIVGYGLWDGNFHSYTRSGDRIPFRVLSYGRPAPEARVRLCTARGWCREKITDSDGRVTFQLIRDYYPDSWSHFRSQHRDRFYVTAEYEIKDKGTYSGETYNAIKMVSTLSWWYSPSRKDYTSYLAGFSVGMITLTLTGVSIFIYRERRKRPLKEVVFNEKD